MRGGEADRGLRIRYVQYDLQRTQVGWIQCDGCTLLIAGYHTDDFLRQCAVPARRSYLWREAIRALCSHRMDGMGCNGTWTMRDIRGLEIFLEEPPHPW